MIVMKFGGSSLRDPESLQHLARIIQKSGFSRRVVALSAVQGITDRLILATNDALENESTVRTSLDGLFGVHRPLIENGIRDTEIRGKLNRMMDDFISRLQKLLKGVAYTGEATPRTRDQIVSMGERMAVHLMAGYLNDLGEKAEPVESDRLNMLTHGPFGHGTVDQQVVRREIPGALNPILKQGIIPVVTGFFGRNEDGDTITFGRGGTDYTAAILADALEAERLEIWKDVDGFLSGSPEMVKDGHFLANLSYDEAAELAYFGAKILHPRTVEPLLERNIPIVIRNAFKPDQVGTWIGAESHVSESVVKSVTFDRNIAMLRLHGADLGYVVGFLSTLISELSASHINIRSVMTSQTCINILLDRKDLSAAHAHLQSLNLEGIDTMDPIENICLVAIVGEGLSHSEDMVARAIHALSQARIHAEIIISGASRVAAYLIVRDDSLKKAVRVVHHTFFGHLEDKE